MNYNGAKNEFKVISYITIFIISFTIIICSIFIASPFKRTSSFELGDDTIKYVKDEGVIVRGSDKVKVYNTTTEKVEEISLEDYIVGVVAAEMPAEFNEEAIKAQSIAARTFYFSKRISPCKTAKEHGAEICSSTHCQAYMSKDERMQKWDSVKAETYWDKIVSSVKATEGEVMIYEDEIVKYPQFFAISGGKTEDSLEVFSGDIPYLKSVDSSWDEEATKYSTTKEIGFDEFVNTINKTYKDSGVTTANVKDKVKIESRTNAEYVKSIALGTKSISGIDFRKLFDLRSSNFTIEYGNDVVKINCKGYGHGVGMSQWGANFMGKDGKNYKEILKHYYSGIEIEKIVYK